MLHDRPPSFFGPTPVAARHELFLRLKPQLDAWQVQRQYREATGVTVKPNEETPFTVMAATAGSKNKSKKAVELRAWERPALVVSSTSWTEEEDFGLLLDALEGLDRRWAGEEEDDEEEEEQQQEQHGRGSASGRRTPTRAARQQQQRRPSSQGKQAPPPPPFLVVAVTGKGPQKAHYEARIRRLALRRVAVCTLWLEAADYPLLVGAADVGVCLHASTSGIDLPMKVLDMYGCELPVCALGFACLPELVRHQVCGVRRRMGQDIPRDTTRMCRADAETGDSCRRGSCRVSRVYFLKHNVRRTASSSSTAPSWPTSWTRSCGASQRTRRCSTDCAKACGAWPGGRRTGGSTPRRSCWGRRRRRGGRAGSCCGLCCWGWWWWPWAWASRWCRR